MTYVKQLEAYEEAVMQKRMEEMTDVELQRLMNEVEASKQLQNPGSSSSSSSSTPPGQ